MTEKAKTHEARLRALEAAILVPSANPGAITLREHFEARLAALEKATDVAAQAMNNRLAGMNEFRDTLKDQASRFVTRQEMEAAIQINREAIGELKTFKDRLEGKASQASVYVSYGIALAGLAISVFSLLVK